MNIFKALREDHDTQRELLKTLVDTSGESSFRRKQYLELKKQLQSHAAAEERFFYSPLIDSDTTIELSRHGIAEHHDIDKLINKLDDTDMTSPSWLHTMKQLQHKVEHHLEEEEHSFFQVAGKVLEEDTKQELAENYHAEMAEQLQ